MYCCMTNSVQHYVVEDLQKYSFIIILDTYFVCLYLWINIEKMYDLCSNFNKITIYFKFVTEIINGENQNIFFQKS